MTSESSSWRDVHTRMGTRSPLMVEGRVMVCIQSRFEQDSSWTFSRALGGCKGFGVVDCGVPAKLQLWAALERKRIRQTSAQKPTGTFEGALVLTQSGELGKAAERVPDSRS